MIGSFWYFSFHYWWCYCVFFPFFGICCCVIICCLWLCACNQLPCVGVFLLALSLVLGFWLGIGEILCFAGYSSLGWHSWSLNVCIMLEQDLLAFIVSIEKSIVILISLSLYVTWHFSLVFFLYSVFCMFSVWFLCAKQPFFLSSLFGVL